MASGCSLATLGTRRASSKQAAKRVCKNPLNSRRVKPTTGLQPLQPFPHVTRGGPFFEQDVASDAQRPTMSGGVELRSPRRYAPVATADAIEVTFRKRRLGLDLRFDHEKCAAVLAEDGCEGLKKGDALDAIDGDASRVGDEEAFQALFFRLADGARPTCLRFRRGDKPAAPRPAAAATGASRARAANRLRRNRAGSSSDESRRRASSTATGVAAAPRPRRGDSAGTRRDERFGYSAEASATPRHVSRPTGTGSRRG